MDAKVLPWVRVIHTLIPVGFGVRRYRGSPDGEGYGYRGSLHGKGNGTGNGNNHRSKKGNGSSLVQWDGSGTVTRQ